MFNQSEKLQNLVSQLIEKNDGDDEDVFDAADSTVTTGYDNDGSTGFEIFSNGFGLAQAAKGKEVYEVVSPHDMVSWFFIGSEEEIAKKLSKLLEQA